MVGLAFGSVDEWPKAASNKLRRGINVTDWFRNPARTPAAMAAYLGDDDVNQIVRAGFTYVRLPVMPDVIQNKDGSLNQTKVAVLIQSIGRLERQGLAVMIVVFHDHWHLETQPKDQALLLELWKQLALAMASLNPALTFPELLNEPTFPDIAVWTRLESELLAVVRKSLPRNTVVLAGNDYASIAGLLQSTPVSDRNVIYSFHYYNPPTLTAHAAWDKTIDGSALRSLPFPVINEQDCVTRVEDSQDKRTRGLGRWYCAQHWDASRIAQQISRVRIWAERNHVVIVAPEFGIKADHDRQSRLRYVAAVRSIFEASGFGWGFWGLDDSFGFAIEPRNLPHAPQLDNGTLLALGLRKKTLPLHRGLRFNATTPNVIH